VVALGAESTSPRDVRVNRLATRSGEADVRAVVCAGLPGIAVPKSERADHVAAAADALTAAEVSARLPAGAVAGRRRGDRVEDTPAGASPALGLRRDVPAADRGHPAGRRVALGQEATDVARYEPMEKCSRRRAGSESSDEAMAKPRIHVATGAGPDVLVGLWPGAKPLRLAAGVARTYLDTSDAPDTTWRLTVWDLATRRFRAGWEVEPGDEHLGMLVRVVREEIALLTVEGEAP
jgi:hypothetical protein